MSKILAFLIFATLALPANLSNHLTTNLAVVSQPQPIPAEEIMAMRPFVATDLTMFNPRLCTPDSTVVSVPAEAPEELAQANLENENERNTAYEAYYEQRLTEYMAAEDVDTQAMALAIFNGETYDEIDYSPLLSKIPAPALRTGLAGLIGTIGEPAINNYLFNNQVVSVEFVDFDQMVASNILTEGERGGIALVMPLADGDHVWVDSQYQYENLGLFSRLLAHELGHQDSQSEIDALNNPRYRVRNATYEEAAMAALDAYIYMQILVNHPEIAQGSTKLARLSNTRTLLILNLGTGSTLGLFATNDNRSIFPDCNPDRFANWTSFVDSWTDQKDIRTPGNEIVDEYVFNLSGKKPPEGQHFEFSLDPEIGILTIIDEAGNGPMTAQELVRVAIALKLDVPPCSDCEVEADKSLKLSTGALARIIVLCNYLVSPGVRCC